MSRPTTSSLRGRRATRVTYAEQSEWKTYQTRVVVSTANKVNLEFDSAVPELKAGLTRSLAGLF